MTKGLAIFALMFGIMCAAIMFIQVLEQWKCSQRWTPLSAHYEDGACRVFYKSEWVRK